MGRLLAIDYGKRRCGIAVTDPLRIVATPLATVATAEVPEYVKRYVTQQQVDAVIVGLPRTMQGAPSDSMRYIRPGVSLLKKAVPGLEVIFWDERFTSVLAHRGMIDSGMTKSQRRDKEVVDRMAAVIILNSYLESRAYNEPMSPSEQ